MKNKIIREKLKEILLKRPNRDYFAVINATKTKEEIVDFLLKTDTQMLENALWTELGWKFNIIPSKEFRKKLGLGEKN